MLVLTEGSCYVYRNPNAKGKRAMHTEEEAKTKWCPFARIAAIATLNGTAAPTNIPTYNRLLRAFEDNSAKDIRDTSCNCIASECMAWRWTDWQKEIIAAGGYDQTEKPTEQPMGYCGLAGKLE